LDRVQRIKEQYKQGETNEKPCELFVLADCPSASESDSPSPLAIAQAAGRLARQLVNFQPTGFCNIDCRYC
jgi:sulfatase maturation enzyme AslB (radical SAM superfamily)